MDHDHSYKLLFSHQLMMADLLRGFVAPDWVHLLDLTTLERVMASQVSEDLQERTDDILWRVRWPEGWVYLYVLVEFQSTVYRYMAVRVATYETLLYEGLIRSRQLTASGHLPPVVPIVLYNGRRRWTAPRDLGELIAQGPEALAVYRPRRPYVLIEERRYRERTLARMRNLVAALFRLEKSTTPTEVQQVLAVLITWLQDPEQEGLRRAFTVWLNRVFLPARLPTVPIPEVQDLVEVQSMLAERVIEWTQQWKEEGRQEGLAAERALLVRQARTRFGESCAAALAPLLETHTDTAVLADIGEWIVTVSSGEALLERVQQCQGFGA